MPLTFDWFLPTTGDSRALVGGGHSVPSDLGRSGGAIDTAGRFREPDLRYLAHVARTAEDLGFDAVLTPTGTPCEDAWVVASALIPETERLKFLVVLRPGLITPTLLAQMSSTFQRLSGNRLLLNVVVGGDPSEQRRFGDRVTKDDRYARAAEFLQVFRESFTEAGSSFTGDFYDVEDARTRRAAQVPEIYLGGSSAAAAQEVLKTSESEGQRRMRELHGGRYDPTDARSLEVHPALWSGIGLMRSGAGTALVGSHTEVADLIGEYADVGIEEFILSGYPHVEEAYWFAEGVLPILRRRGLLA